MKNTLSLAETTLRVKKTLVFVTWIVAIIINIADSFRHEEQTMIWVNAATCFILVIIIVLYFIKLISVKYIYLLIVYSLILNIIISSRLTIDSPYATSVWTKHVIYLLLLMTITGLVVDKWNSLAIGIVSIAQLISLYIITKNEFLGDSLLPLILVTLLYTLTIFYIIYIIDRLFKVQIQLSENLAQKNTELKFYAENLKEVNRLLVLQRDEISESQQQLLKSNQTKDKLFNIIAHDLKSPLSIVLGFAELLKGNLVKMDYEKLNSYIDIIYGSVFHLDSLLQTLLNWSRAQMSAIQYNPCCFNLNNLLEECIKNQELIAQAKSIKLILISTKNYEIESDRNLLEIVFRNLISNAIKFSYCSAIIEILIEEIPSFIVIKVKDFGKGIDSETIAKILDPTTFYTSTGTKNESGNGLGLKICQDFIAICNGTMKIESKPEKYTIFHIALPKKNYSTDK